MKRKCDNCGKEYIADMRNVKRGWGLCCSKSCAAKKRERTSVPSKKQLKCRKDWCRRLTHCDDWRDGDRDLHPHDSEALGQD